jgi:predicted amidophosphoribosyltransferase
MNWSNKMKDLIDTQKLCVQCEQELSFFRQLRGDLYCNDLCRQQKSREAIARVKAGSHGNTEQPVPAH